MDGEGQQRSSVVSQQSNSDFPPPPVEKPASIQTPASPGEFPGDEFDDELRCSVLYDFSGKQPL